LYVERVINFYEELYPGDAQLHLVLTVLNDYLDEKIKFKELRRVILETYKIARETKNLPAQFALRAATLAPPVGHSKEHNLGTALYAVKAIFYARQGDFQKLEEE
jgi:hypothetical protein